MNTVKRAVVKRLLRFSKIVDRSELAGFIKFSPAVRYMSPDLRDLIDNDMRKWEGGQNRSDVTKTVRRLCREVDNMNVGFEAGRFLETFSDIIQVPVNRVFKVGDVVKHKLFNEIGVIIATHPTCAMKPGWCLQNLGCVDHPLINEPWYDIVLDDKHGGYQRHGANRNHHIVKVPVNNTQLKANGWIFNEDTGNYQPPHWYVPSTSA
eukprot:TRINITY_DN8259_c3_g1_i1.p1 TRINITY_DN8259_c3_g1~~TRINITY_DN8259_c3_g1_i1.p1  ORF type:complete len:207 (+),score=28.38 TRINITY_DN8259_c3_g1_i1:91-711(+)